MWCSFQLAWRWLRGTLPEPADLPVHQRTIRYLEEQQIESIKAMSERKDYVENLLIYRRDNGRGKE